jgi:hypothetical protein
MDETKVVTVADGAAVPAPVKCRICGKILTDPDSMVKGIGPECESKGYTPEAIAAKKAELSGETVPEGWIKIGVACDRLREMGIPHTRLVAAVGGDRGMGTLLNETFRPLYVGRQRWLHPEIFSETNLELLKAGARKPKVVDPNAPKKEKKVKEPKLNPDGTPVPVAEKKEKKAKKEEVDPEAFYRAQLEKAAGGG